MVILRLLRTFVGVLPCPLGKNSYARHFKGKHGKLYIVGKLNNCRFREKISIASCLIPQRKIGKMTAKMTMRHSIKQMN